MPEDRIEIENINTPGRIERVDRVKCLAMREAVLTVLLEKPPGSVVADARAALLDRWPDDLLPQGRTAG